jgi:hypothetical protein
LAVRRDREHDEAEARDFCPAGDLGEHDGADYGRERGQQRDHQSVLEFPRFGGQGDLARLDSPTSIRRAARPLNARRVRPVSR